MYSSFITVVNPTLAKGIMPKDSWEKMTLKTAAMLLAAGVDPKKATLFCQSQAEYHHELTWILACATPMKWLKGSEMKNYFTENNSIATHVSELARISGIMLYKTEEAVFGEDWQNTIKLAGDLAEGLNLLIKENHFKRPQLYKAPYYGVYKVNDLQNEQNKMARINQNKRGSIYLDDTEKDIREKVMRAKSDSIKEVRFLVRLDIF